MTDTIFALSSGMPPAAIGVIRISGPDAMASVAALTKRLPEPRRAALRRLTDPADGSPLDDALIVLFPGPATATGEDLAELHVHGGRAVVARIEAVLAAMPGLRRAEPGEFTRRALANGRIDLTEAEGLGDLLSAETESQRRAALASAEGAVRRRVEGWQARLLTLSAGIEAVLDHGDEGDVDADPAALDAIRTGAAALTDEMAAVLANPPVERLRDGIRVVLAGPPNAGKSTLINALTQRDAAIVSPIAGTTRDRIEVPVQRGGLAWLFTDTAGLAEATEDAIEAIGIERSLSAMAAADILLWLGDAPSPVADAVLIHARCDLPERAEVPEGRIPLSAARVEGLDALWAELDRRAGALVPRLDETVLNRRQAALIAEAADHVRSASSAFDPLILAEELRAARLAFDRVTGRADTEAMLDMLFSRFCIGK